MRMLVIGASRGIGRLTVEAGSKRGHHVRALSRSGMEMPADGVESIQGDATDPAALGAALEGMEIVLFTLGLHRSIANYSRPVTLFSDATAALLPLLEAHGPKRLIVVTGFGAGDSKQAMSTLERIGHSVLLGRPYADKDRQEDMVRASSLDWTLVRPVILTNNEASGRYRVLADPETWRNGLIARADVADFLIREAEEGAHVQGAVVLAR